MEKIRVIKLEDTIFRRILHIYIGDYSDFQEYMEARYDSFEVEEYEEGCEPAGFAHHEIGEAELQDGLTKHFYMWLPEWNGTLTDVCTLSHELNHVTFRVMQHIEITLTEESEESFTYYQESLLFQALSELGYKKLTQ